MPKHAGVADAMRVAVAEATLPLPAYMIFFKFRSNLTHDKNKDYWTFALNRR